MSRPLGYSFKVLLDTIVDPGRAAKIFAERRPWIVAALLVYLSLAVSGLLCSPTARHLAATEMRAEIASGAYGDISPYEQAQKLATAGDFNATQFFLNVAVLGTVVLLLVLVEAAILNLVAMIAGHPSFATGWSTSINICAVTFGGYLIVNGLLTFFIGPSQVSSYAELSAVTPSLLLFIPGLKGGFWHGFASAINPFSLLSGGLIFYFARASMTIRNFSVRVALTVLSLIAGAIMQGIGGIGD